MKKCDNSTRKIHISSNFILSISLLSLLIIAHREINDALLIWIQNT